MALHLIPNCKKRIASALASLPFSSRVLGPPKGSHACALDAIPGMKKGGGKLIVAREPIEYVQPPARTVEDEASYFKGRRERLHPYAAAFARGRVYGKEGIVILPDDRIALDLLPAYYVDKKYAANGGPRVLRRLKLPSLRKVDGRVVSLALGDTQNYSHWTFQNMTRLQLLKSARIDADFYYIDISQRFQREYLEIMGVPKEKVIPVDSRAHIQAAELIIVGGCSFNQAPHPDLLHELRKVVLGSDTVLPSRRLYVSRADASYRQVCNESDVMAYLAPYGFERVLMTDLSVRDQARLLQQATVVIGSHGANMTNLMFCQPGTHVLEVFQPNWVDSGFTAPSAQVGLRYFYALGEECSRHRHVVEHPGMAPCFRF